jgi:P pilus assembly chaperone PapD
MRIRTLLVACLVVIASLIALPADAAGSVQFRKIRYDSPGTERQAAYRKGSNTSSNLYWDRGWYVWNNDGDKAILRSSSDTLTDTCTWGDGIGYKNC